MLETAKGYYKSVITVGVDHDDCLCVRASVNLTHGEILWHLKEFEYRLLGGEYAV